MKDYLIDQLRTTDDPTKGQNFAREYLQARVLGVLQQNGAMVPLAFHGGTALRFLYGSSRYSEDLDFTREFPKEAYDLRAWLRAIRTELATEGYRIDIKVNDRKVVHSAFLQFQGLLHELALSPHPEAVLSIKIEVDTRPPDGAILETTLIRRHVPLRLQHHDRTSLLAGKLHAILQRPYTKGRDIYDLFWYLSDPDWPAPNITLLNHALAQTGWEGDTITADNWRKIVAGRLQTLTWERVVGDVQPFLERKDDINLLSLDNLLQLL